MNKEDIDLIKVYLSDRHNVLILSDMPGPTHLNGGHVLTARTITFTESDDNSSRADKIFDFMKEVQHNTAAFYKCNEKWARVGTCHIGE